MLFGDILRELLEEEGISQKQLAHDLNISAPTLGNYVRNLRQPDFETVKRIAAYFSELLPTIFWTIARSHPPPVRKKIS